MADIRDQITFASSQSAPTGNEQPTQVQNEPTPTPVIEAEGENLQTQDDGSQSSPPEESKDDQAKEETSEKTHKNGVERKIGKEVARRKEAEERAFKAEQRLHEIEQRQQALKKDVDLDSMTFDERVAYVAKEQTQQALIENEKSQAERDVNEYKQMSWQSQLQEASQIHKDFFEVVENAKPIFDSIPLQTQEAVAQLKDGALIAYEIAKNPEIARQLAQTTNPVAQATILMTLQQKVQSYQNSGEIVSAQKPPINPAKPTPSPQNNGLAPVKNRFQLNMYDFMKDSYAKGILRR